MTALWIRNASVVDRRGAYRADVVVRGDRFEALGVVRPFGAFEEMDAVGLWLLAGALDPRSQRFEPSEPLRPGREADLVAVDPTGLATSARQDGGARLVCDGGLVGGAVRWVMVRGEVEGR